MNVAGALPEQGQGVKRSFPRDCEESPRSSHAADAPEVEEQLCELRYASARSALRKAQAEARRYRVSAANGNSTARKYLRTAESRLHAAQREEDSAYESCQSLQRNRDRRQAKAIRLCELNARASPLLALGNDLLLHILQQPCLDAVDLAMLDCTCQRLRECVEVRTDQSSLKHTASSVPLIDPSTASCSSAPSTSATHANGSKRNHSERELLTLTEAAARNKAWSELGITSRHGMGPTRPLCASWKEELVKGAILLQETGLWKIHGFSKFAQRKFRRRMKNPPRLFSDTFIRGGVPWRLLLFPRGNHVEHLSLYLDVADSDSLPLGWMRYAKFVLYVVNPHDYSQSVSKGTSHVFTSRENDWGFTMMVPLEDLEKGGFLCDDMLCLRVDVEEARDGSET